MNDLHPRLKFEIKKPTSPEGLSLSFLDFKVALSENGESSSVESYKKLTENPLFVNHQSFKPRNSVEHKLHP